MPVWRRLLAGEGWPTALLAGLLLTLYAFSVSTVPIRTDNDCWWHVKSGKIIAEEGLPHHDIFSYTAEGYEWHNHEWLTQLAMWKIWQVGEGTALGGWRTVILAKSTVLWVGYLVLFLLAGRISRNWWVALLVVSIALAVGRRTFYPRPPLVSNVMLAVQILLITGVHEKWWSKKWLLALPPFFALWSNLHGAWMAGLVVLAAYAGSDFLATIPGRDRIGRYIDHVPGPVSWKLWGALFPACVVGTFLNPFGWQLYELPARVMSDKSLTAAIGELQPPVWRFVWIFLGSLGATVLVLGWLLIKRRFPRRLAEWGIYLFFLYQGVNHVRHLLLFGVMSVPLLARAFGRARDTLVGTETIPTRRALAVGAGVLVTALAVQAAVLRNYPEYYSYPERNRHFAMVEDGYLRAGFPAEPCDFIEGVVFEGRMFNENHYAGYLIWRLSPDLHKVFSDSRFDIFGGEIWRQEAIVAGALVPPGETGLPGWREVLEHWDVNWMLIKNGTGLSETLQSGDEGWALVADWSEVYPRTPWQIWVRDTPENASLIDRARDRFEDLSRTGGRP